MVASPAAVTSRPARAPAEVPAERSATARWAPPAVAAVVIAGLALRLWARSDLWLDEALTVNLARLGVGDLFDALRLEAHPPLYYLLLHGWIELFGDGDIAVRSLSAVFSLATLPLAWAAGRRLGGRPAAVAGLVLLASSPYAVRYATEARMYSLLMLEVVAGWLIARRALDRPSPRWLAGVAAVSGALLLTHYWSIYLLAAVGLVLTWRWWPGRGQRVGDRPDRAAGRVLLGLVAGGLLFLPWLPSFLDQAASTGTPWGRPARPANVVMSTLNDIGGGLYGEASLLGVAIALLAIAAVVGRRTPGGIELRPDRRAKGLAEAAVVLATLALAVIASYATASAFASRYASVIVPLVLLLAGLGATLLPRRARVVVLGVLVVAGLFGSVRSMFEQRTQAGELAAVIGDDAAGGDLVVFCPDQLGPAHDRLLPDRVDAATFPGGTSPEFVDWRDYAERIGAGDPAAFAAAMDERAGGGTIWYAWAGQYRTLERQCEELKEALEVRRPGRIPRVESGTAFEHAALEQYPPAP